MTTREEVPDTIPGGHVREGAAVVQTLAQIAAVRRDMIERRHLEEMRDIRHQQERAEMLQRQAERDAARKAEMAERDAERRAEMAERDRLRDEKATARDAERKAEMAARDAERRAEMAERDRLRDEKAEARDAERKAEMAARDAKADARDAERRAEMAERDRQRNAEMAAREQERRLNRIDQLKGRTERAARDINAAIADLAEAERRLNYLREDAQLKHADFDEALDRNRPDYEIRRLRDIANRADEEVRRGIAAVGKAELRVEDATARYDAELRSLRAAVRDFNEHQAAAAPATEAPGTEREAASERRPGPDSNRAGDAAGISDDATASGAGQAPETDQAGRDAGAQAEPDQDIGPRDGRIPAFAERLDTPGVPDDRLRRLASAPAQLEAGPSAHAQASKALVIADAEGAEALAAAERVANPAGSAAAAATNTPSTASAPSTPVSEQSRTRRTR
ncbi:hypothetical protein GCM10027258_92710 [Amycolatopsis stemonae]